MRCPVCHHDHLDMPQGWFCDQPQGPTSCECRLVRKDIDRAMRAHQNCHTLDRTPDHDVSRHYREPDRFAALGDDHECGLECSDAVIEADDLRGQR